MATPEVTAYQGQDGCRLDFALARGGRICVFVLRHDLVRVLFLPDDKPRVPHTWSIAPDGEDVPWEGRARLEGFGGPGPEFHTTDSANGLRIQTDMVCLDINYSPLLP